MLFDDAPVFICEKVASVPMVLHIPHDIDLVVLHFHVDVQAFVISIFWAQCYDFFCYF